MAEQGIITDLRQRFDNWWNARPEPTPGQIDQERETRVSLGLMAQAADAPEPTPEQQIFLSQSEHGMRERLSVLLGIPHRSLAQEREKVAIEQWLGRDRSVQPLTSNSQPLTSNLGQQTRGFLGPLAPAGLAVGMVRPWMLWTGAIAAVGVWGAYNDVRAGRLENERNEARAEVQNLQEEVMAANAVRDSLADAVREADELSRATAANLEAERARNARARALEQRRSRELRQVDAGGPPPAWERSLRDDGLSETGPDSGGGAAPGNP